MATTQNILSELFETIQKTDSSIIAAGKGKDQAPLSMLYESYQPAILAEIGIRSLTFKHSPQHEALSAINLTLENASHNPQQLLDRNLGSEGMKNLLHDCQIIAFSDWSNFQHASDLWDRLRFDVIKPLQRNDFDFIFYLGDPTKKMGYEVDEILDIISDFSLHGRVSLVINEQAAAKLWTLWYGQLSGKSPTVHEIAQYLLETVKIDRILILSIYQARAFYKDQNFTWRARSAISSKKIRNFTDYFNVGYSLGLHLNLEITHCMALGLAILGAYVENGSSPDLQALLSYIEAWMDELGSPVAKI